MIVKNIIEEDFSNYRECAMFIGFPHCTFKCETECNCPGMCQNSTLAKSPDIEISPKEIVNRYIKNPLTHAVVCGGLEPIDSLYDLVDLIIELRSYCEDTVVIYTGYNKDEISFIVDRLKQFKNIIIKFGRFVPNQEKHYDEILGVSLASDNQYAEVIS